MIPPSGSLEELVSSKQTLLKEKELQARHLEEKERQLQQEVHLLYVLDYLCTTLSKEDTFRLKTCLSVLQVSHLQEELTTLKKTSEQETGHLWAQLDSMRTSRQELGGESSQGL